MVQPVKKESDRGEHNKVLSNNLVLRFLASPGLIYGRFQAETPQVGQYMLAWCYAHHVIPLTQGKIPAMIRFPAEWSEWIELLLASPD